MTNSSGFLTGFIMIRDVDKSLMPANFTARLKKRKLLGKDMG